MSCHATSSIVIAIFGRDCASNGTTHRDSASRRVIFIVADASTPQSTYVFSRTFGSVLARFLRVAVRQNPECRIGDIPAVLRTKSFHGDWISGFQICLDPAMRGRT